MKIYSLIEEFSSSYPCVFTFGFFDGVHIGHQRIIQNLVVNKKKKYCSVLLTFNPHPQEILYPNKKFYYLNTLSERISNLKNTGIEHLIIHPFTRIFSKLSTKIFYQKILHYKLNIDKMIVGYDFHIGKNRRNSYNELKILSQKKKFRLYKIPPFQLQNKIISSTEIRKSLLLGNLEWANESLGYFYTLSGYVVRGIGLGKVMKYPTANFIVDSKKLVPKRGVYAVQIHYVNQIYKGMLNIGLNPTIHHKNRKTKLEVHIFNFFQEIYGKKIKISMIKIIREEIQFQSINELKNQIIKDEYKIKTFFKMKNVS
ncbi:bifunctional riboflavin kinase/FAD synthetase [Blattabacterium cuenoti]|uniref:bifunctional riboflavin kinase/FAD synthetase n=1 Tax=Blattabacterium cuenoti TaxID=1653831 RepID=UPI00163C5D62|nr:bifunctional riboflavin kinase/FAD synthetase [Blattabacterium cuenoti]